MTDERLESRLWEAIDRLPDGQSGIVFRHYATPAEDRRTLARDIAAACRSRAIALAIARDCVLAAELGAALVHNPDGPSALPISMAVHDMADAARARDRGAALIFVSPVHATRSHPGRQPLGPTHAEEIARSAGVPAIALGGMDEHAFAALSAGAFHGWAGIDAWLVRDGPGE